MAHEITIPRLGWSMEEGIFSGWIKKDGDSVKPGEALFSLEGEKAIQEIESLDEGILRIPPTGPQVGQVVKVGAVIGYIVAIGEEAPSVPRRSVDAIQASSLPNEQPFNAQSTHSPIASPSVRRRAREIGVSLQAVTGTGPGGRITAADLSRSATAVPTNASLSGQEGEAPAELGHKVSSPRARRVAKELGVDWRQLEGTGAGGRVRERDVRSAGTQPLSMGESRSIPNRRRIIAERLTASHQLTVPVTLTTKADATNLVSLREQFRAVEGASVVPSYQDLIVKLVGQLLTKHPMMAARMEKEAIVLSISDELGIGIAVDTEDGLLVPVLRRVPRLTIMELATQSLQLIELSRAGKLTAGQMQGGVFTVTNLGAFGIDAFTPVINLPQSAILGLGTIRTEPSFDEAGKVVARRFMTLSLTFDHRIVDGAPAARFLQDLVKAIANPSAYLLAQ